MTGNQRTQAVYSAISRKHNKNTQYCIHYGDSIHGHLHAPWRGGVLHHASGVRYTHIRSQEAAEFMQWLTQGHVNDVLARGAASAEVDAHRSADHACSLVTQLHRS
jgi:hypothetical protein